MYAYSSITIAWGYGAWWLSPVYKVKETWHTTTHMHALSLRIWTLNSINSGSFAGNFFRKFSAFPNLASLKKASWKIKAGWLNVTTTWHHLFFILTHHFHLQDCKSWCGIIIWKLAMIKLGILMHTYICR